MKTLAELRQMFPQYAEVSDGDFLIGIQRKYYPGMHPRQFMDAIDGAANAFTTITRPDFKEYWRTEVQKPMPGETPEQAGARAGGTSYGPADPGGAMGAGARSLLQGQSYGYADEAVAAGTSALSGNSYDFELAKERARLDAGREQYPGLSLGAEIGGALSVPLGAVKGTGNLLMDVAKSAGAGGALSALYGFGAGEGGAANRVDSAVNSGIWGAGLSAAAPVVGAAAQKVMDANALRKALKDAVQNAPTTEQLRQAGKSAYKAVDDLGVTLQPQSVANMGDDAIAAMRQQGLDTGPMSLTPQSARLSEVIQETTGGGNPIPFSELELLRRKAGIPAGNVTAKTESALGSEVIGKIDDYVANLGPGDVAGGDGEALSSAITKAREIWAMRSKSGMIDDIMEKAQGYVSGEASGIRNQFATILRNPKLARGFTEAEKTLMRRAINGSLPQRMLHLAANGMGRHVATGMGAALGAGAGMAGGFPAAMAASALGGMAGLGSSTVLQKLSEALAQKEAGQFRAVVASGGMKALPKADDYVRGLIENMLRRGTAAGLQQ